MFDIKGKILEEIDLKTNRAELRRQVKIFVKKYKFLTIKSVWEEILALKENN